MKGKTIKKGILHFSLGDGFGEMVTNIAREKAWYTLKEGDAILMLIENLDVTPDQAREIIHGKKKLITNDDHKTVSLIDDNWTPPDFTKMKKEIHRYIENAENLLEKANKGKLFIYSDDERYINAEIWRIRRMREVNIWEAHEQATALERMILDIHNEHREEARERFKDTKVRKEFMGNPVLDDDTQEIFDELDEIIDEAEKDLFTEQQKAALDAERKAVTHFKEVMAKRSPIDAVKENAMLQIATSDLDPKFKERAMRYIEGMDQPIKIKVDRTFEYDTGWLDREGKYYSCEIGQHIRLADMLVDEFYPNVTGDPEQILEERGWMKCTGASWYETKRRPTQAQLRTIERWKEKWPDYGYHEGYY